MNETTLFIKEGNNLITVLCNKKRLIKLRVDKSNNQIIIFPDKLLEDGKEVMVVLR